MNKTNNTFETLYAINVNENTEKKGNLTYLSWAWAWAEFQKALPNSSYGIVKTKDKDDVLQPYTASEMGIMCETWVKATDDSEPKTMWLPVMDSKNRAMKTTAYEVTTKWGKDSIPAATMFDVNKTLMRCLVKNLAMFGLGLYIYAGEDLPETEQAIPKAPAPAPVKTPVRKKLVSGTEEFNKAITGLKEGKYTLEKLIANYTITKADANLLMKASNG